MFDVLLVLYAHALGDPGAHGQEDSVESFLLEAVERKVLAQLLPGLRAHAMRKQEIDFLVQDALRQAEIGNAVAQHAAELGLLVVDHDAEALQPQVVRAGEPSRPSADDGDLLAVFLERRLGVRLRVLEDVVADAALDGPYRYGAVLLAAIAALLAEMRAHAAGDGRHRVVLQDYPSRLGDLAGPYAFHIPRYVDVVRAARAAAGASDPHRPEYRMEAILAGQRRAHVAALAEAMEGVVGIPVVPATRFLADVAADGSHVPQLGRRDRVGRIGQQGDGSCGPSCP